MRAVGSDGVVVQLKRGEVIVVNETGRRVLELIRDGQATEQQLVDSLGREFRVSTAEAREHVSGYLAALTEAGIVQPIT